jgi:hypothetical protein
MPAFYRATIGEFICKSESELIGLLSTAYALGGFEKQRASQTLAWANDIIRLQSVLGSIVHTASGSNQWSLLLEFPIPRKGKRIDVVILAGDNILILELKSSSPGVESIRQAEEYALLLHYFHHPSNRRKITAYVVSPAGGMSPEPTQQFLPMLEAPAYWIAPVERISWDQLPDRLLRLASQASSDPINPTVWDEGEYRPVPNIIEAALSLQAGLDIREIAHSRAARHDVDKLTRFVTELIEESRANSRFTICFVTGVPGSGKTLVGLNLSFGTRPGQEPIHFMSGTGPLVQVLQAVLAEDHRKRTKVRANEARIHAKTLIENVHVFAKHYADEDTERAPSNHVIIFDEAQRAWDRAQNFSKFKRNYSEPEMLLRIMERHSDWAAVIALVGGGQEINSGEAGLEEWGRALGTTSKQWSVYASPEAIEGGSSVAGSMLRMPESDRPLSLHKEQQLHLDVSVRSLKADSYATWVNHVLNGDAESAAALKAQDHFPIILTRSLADLRLLLSQNTMGSSRCGLVASSRAARLRAEGLEPDSAFHGAYPWHHWYLASQSDVRSSFQMEVFATEFEIQGLELDWIGLCWGGDLIWSSLRQAWLIRRLSPGKNNKWTPVRGEQQQTYRRNAYRVLMTRSRQGIVLFIPKGDSSDPTRSPVEFDATADFLTLCGARLAPTHIPMATATEIPPKLFL